MLLVFNNQQLHVHRSVALRLPYINTRREAQMNNYLRKGIGGAILTLLLVAGATAVASATAQAQYRQYPDNRDWKYRRDQRDRERDNRDRDVRYLREQRYRRNNGYGDTRGTNRNGVRGNSDAHGQ